ncbi:MAG: XVIPCD domain-containing protein, partial [Lysobacter sp.]
MTPAERTAKLETMLKDFEKTNPDSGKNLRGMLSHSPELNARVLSAIDAGSLNKFEALSASDRAAGVIGGYDATNNRMLLPTDLLDVADKNKVASNRVLITVGHEIEHAVNKADINKSRSDFEASVTKIAAGPSPHDYTATVKTQNQSQRTREAHDEIAGVNVLAAQVRRDNPKATLEDLYLASPGDMAAYIKQDNSKSPPTYAARPGLTLS